MNNEQLLVELGSRLLPSEIQQLVDKIKLEAFKAGAKWAADCLQEAAKLTLQIDPSQKEFCGFVTGMGTDILNVSSNLKEIPKD